MDDFIKRSDAQKVIKSANRMVSCLFESTMKLCVAMDRIAAADVVPVRHGRWNEYDDDYGNLSCSVCENDAPSDIPWDYCPHCGAKMDEDG